jgi:hypothetical protein
MNEQKRKVLEDLRRYLAENPDAPEAEKAMIKEFIAQETRPDLSLTYDIPTNKQPHN